MKITRLHLTNFRSHEDLDLRDLEPFTLIVSPNAQGKTSIAMAIEMLLTGRCAITDAAGHGADELIRTGSAEAMLQAIVRTIGFLGRRWGANGSAIAVRDPRQSLPLKTAQQEIERALGASTAVISATVGSWRFLQMSDVDQRALLAEVLASRAANLPPEIIEGMRVGGLRAAPATIVSASELAAFHRSAFDLRTSLSRELREMGVEDPPEDQPPGDSPAQLRPAAAAAAAELDRISKDRSDRRAEHARLAGRRQEIERVFDAANALVLDGWEQSRLEAETARIQEFRDLQIRESALSQEIQRAESAAAPAETESGVLSQTQLQELVALAARAESTDLREEGRRLAAAVAEIEAQLSLVGRTKGALCPTCERRLPAAARQQLETDIQRRLANARNELASVHRRTPDPMEARDARAAIARHGEALRARERNQARAAQLESTSKLQTERDEVRSKLASLGDPQSARERLAKHREAVAARLRASTDLSNLPEAWQLDTSDLDARADAVRSRVAALESQLEAWRVWEREQASLAERRDRRRYLESRISALTRVVEYLAPRGPAASALMGDRVTEFCGRANACLGAFGYSVALQLDPYAIAVSRDGGASHRLRLLSRSEQWRVGLAIQIALAQMSGLRMVIADEADVLDLAQRASLAWMLLTADLEQAIVLSTGTEVPVATTAGVKFVLLATRVAEPVATTAAARP